jgi:glycyl-tRNA synthetase beta chain
MSTETLLVELGTEELPPKALKALGLAFRDGLEQGLHKRQLEFGQVQWFATPRRLAVLILEVQLQAVEKNIEVLGPPVDRARDSEGNWTAAAIGFAKKQGLEADQLQAIDTAKGPRLGVSKTVSGITTREALVDIINESITQLPIPKRMRWGASRTEFVRPVQWLVVMLGQETGFGPVLGQTAGSVTRGHRFHSEGAVQIQRPEDYVAVLRQAKVIAGFDERQALIREQVEQAASDCGGLAVIDPELLDEVTGLVEWPVALLGSFEERFLQVPAKALILSMKEHQKYFHLEDQSGALLPNFITLANIESTQPEQVIRGNERVIRPRLSDAAFFFETDKKTPLEDRLEQLKTVVFQNELGTLYDKTQRVVTLAGNLADHIGAPVALAKRAATLCKTDLVSDMVLEFSDMQGIAAYHYALHDGEDPEVATALAQQYWPKYSGDQLPESKTACALGLADRLDTLCGIFGIGQPPTGSKDPFALRRASLAVLRIIVGKELTLDLLEALSSACAQYPEDTIDTTTADQVFDYVIERFRSWYEDEGIAPEVFKAVSAKRVTRPLDIHQRVQAVNAFTQLPEAEALAGANKRVSNILAKLESDHPFSNVSLDLLKEPAEIALYEAVSTLGESSDGLISRGAYTEALAGLAQLRDPVDAFFDGVMVNSEDEALRNNRLNLLNTLRELFEQVANISALAVGK